VDPAGEALAKLLGKEKDVDAVKSWLAALICVMFECGPLLPWLILGKHAPTARLPEPVAEIEKPVIEKKPDPPKEKPAEPDQPPPLDLPQEDSVVAAWAKQALVRRKGSYVPAADIRSDFEAWCRLNGHDLTPWNATAFGKEMTRLGFERVKRSGGMRYLDIALIPKTRDLKVVVSNVA